MSPRSISTSSQLYPVLKPLLLFVLVAVLLAGCRPPEEVDYADVGYSKGIYTLGEKPFTGTAVTTFDNGRRHQEFSFKNGLHHGVTREWDEAGTLIVETHFEKGKRHGKNTYWHPDGSLSKKQVYEHGKSVSEEKFPASGAD